MNQILEAAAAAIQKAERAAQLGGGGGGSTFSLPKDTLGSKLTDDSSSSSRGTSRSSASRTNKFGIFGLSDK